MRRYPGFCRGERLPILKGSKNRFSYTFVRWISPRSASTSKMVPVLNCEMPPSGLSTSGISDMAPAAIINENSDLVIVSGCAISGIPLVDRPDGGISQFKTGTILEVDADQGEIHLTNV